MLPDARKVTLLAFGSRDASEEGGTSPLSLEVSAGRASVRRVARGACVSSRRGRTFVQQKQLSAGKAQPLRSSQKRTTVVPGSLEDRGKGPGVEVKEFGAAASQAYSFVGAVPGIIAGALRVSACSQ